MKIDFDMLDKLVAAGASGQVVVAMLREQYARGEVKRKRDKENKIVSRARLGKRQSATTRDKARHKRNSEGDNARQSATESDSARQEREFYNVGKSLLGSRSGGLLSSLLRHHNYDLPAARAVIDAAATKQDPREWVSASMRSKANGQGNDLMAACDDLLSRAGSGPVQGRDFDLDLTPERDGGD